MKLNNSRFSLTFLFFTVLIFISGLVIFFKKPDTKEPQIPVFQSQTFQEFNIYTNNSIIPVSVSSSPNGVMISSLGSYIQVPFQKFQSFKQTETIILPNSTHVFTFEYGKYKFLLSPKQGLSLSDT